MSNMEGVETTCDWCLQEARVQTIDEKLWRFWKIISTEEPNMTSHRNICDKCKSRYEGFSIYIERCKINRSKLHELLSTGQIKDEPSVDIEYPPLIKMENSNEVDSNSFRPAVSSGVFIERQMLVSCSNSPTKRNDSRIDEVLSAGNVKKEPIIEIEGQDIWKEEASDPDYPTASGGKEKDRSFMKNRTNDINMRSLNKDKQSQGNDGNSEDEIFQSSGSEYIPDLSDSESNDEVETSSIDRTLNNTEGRASTSKSCDNPITAGDTLQLDPVDSTIVTFEKFLQTSPKIENFANTRPWTKRSSCPYCSKEVTHFPRHLERNHKNEGAVKTFLALSRNDPKKKDLLNAIRRQGNYESTSHTTIIRPVRRPKSSLNNVYKTNVEQLKESYIVCRDCLGYFKRNYLRRHRKKCTLRPNLGEGEKRENHLSAAQLFTVCSGTHNDFLSKLRLKTEVFPIMRNDELSKIAMNDLLICCFAESLLKKHKRIQIRNNSISNKMRELARLLLALKEITGLQCLFDVMKPQFFDNCVVATKIISGYDENKRTFKASSLAIRMGTTLKQVCEVTAKMVIKKSSLFPCTDPEQTLKDIKRLKSLVENHWNSELASLALKNLNE